MVAHGGLLAVCGVVFTVAAGRGRALPLHRVGTTQLTIGREGAQGSQILVPQRTPATGPTSPDLSVGK
ncbi:hypothetical protein GCM10018773_65370 [Streptomyces candidus]|nr:hypothetical protein GCM10018773_65370 [Streptomyces candidus]